MFFPQVNSAQFKFSPKRQNLLSPESPVDLIRSPAVAKWLENVALRDLVLHETHAACVDVRGDVYQWGNGFFEGKSLQPVLTLRGKVRERLLFTVIHLPQY